MHLESCLIHIIPIVQRYITAFRRNGRILRMTCKRVTGIVPAYLLLWLPCPTRQRTQILCSSHTNLLSVPWVYNVTSHLIISPCNILFSTPKFPLVNSYVSVKSQVTQKSLPSLTTHLPISSHSTKHVCSREHPKMARLFVWSFDSCLSQTSHNCQLLEDSDSLTKRKKCSVCCKAMNRWITVY